MIRAIEMGQTILSVVFGFEKWLHLDYLLANSEKAAGASTPRLERTSRAQKLDFQA